MGAIVISGIIAGCLIVGFIGLVVAVGIGFHSTTNYD